MAFTRTSAALLFVAASIPALASTPAAPFAPTSCEAIAQQALYSLTLAGHGDVAGTGFGTLAGADTLVDGSALLAAPPPREMLAAFAMTLRDIRYRRGGRAPTEGFDCSGFVQYVFAHSLGIDLPDNSGGQFHAGAKVSRGELKTGDLVFFHTRGQSVSHVGIYLDGDRFIHSPSTGKRVRVDHLTDPYWSKRFVAAKRPITT
jgi:cell wall-associated NlpC family hydrolase